MSNNITSSVVQNHLDAGGTIQVIETITGERADDTVHVFTAPDRDGTFTADNAGVVWFDSTPERVVAAIRSGDTSELSSGSVSVI